jgi:hypothetical protein
MDRQRWSIGSSAMIVKLGAESFKHHELLKSQVD